MTREAYVLENCDSTNDFAMQLAREGCQSGTVVIAKHQSKGKGRAGRTWESWPGNLALSIVLRPKIKLESSHELVVASALAIARALEKLDVKASIKWPNDILIEALDETLVSKLGRYRKIGGILLEVAATGQNIDAAVIGIGLNLVRPPNEKADCIIPQMGFIHDLNPNIDLQTLTNAVLHALTLYLPDGDATIPASQILADVKHKSAILGKRVSVDLGERTFEGTAFDLSQDGSLIVRKEDETLERIFYGDVSLVS